MGYEQPRISFLQGLSPRRCFPAGTCSCLCDSLTTPKDPARKHARAVGLAVSSLEYETSLAEIRTTGRRFLRRMAPGAARVSAPGQPAE